MSMYPQNNTIYQSDKTKYVFEKNLDTLQSVEPRF
jgi:hypothetical protein